MLHDIGKLVLWARRPEVYAGVVQAARALGKALYEVEVERLGVSHAEIGAYLLGLWGLPYPIVEAVASHHGPARVPDQSGFGSVGGVHVGQSLAGELAAHETSVIDREYLHELGVLDELPQWDALADQEAVTMGD